MPQPKNPWATLVPPYAPPRQGTPEEWARIVEAEQARQRANQPYQPAVNTPPDPAAVVSAMPTNPATAASAARKLLQLPTPAPAARPAASREGVVAQPGWYVDDLEQMIKDRLQAGSRETTALGDEEYDTVVKRLNDMQIDALREQREGVNQNLGLLKEYNKIPSQLDLSPIAALVDAQTGSNFSRTYKPYDQEVRAQQADLMKAADTLQKSRGAFTKEQVDLLKSNLQGYRTEQMLRDITDKLGQSNKPIADRNRVNPSTVNSFNRELRAQLNKVNTDLSQQKAEFSYMDDAFKSGSWTTLRNGLYKFARAVNEEKGVLSNQDIANIMPKSFAGDVSKFLSYLSDTADADIDPEMTKSLQKMLSLAKTKAKAKYKEKVDTLKEGYSADPLYGGAAAGAVKAAEKNAENFAPDPVRKKSTKELILEALQKNGATKPASGGKPSGSAAPSAPSKKTTRDLILESMKKGK